jgi:hypothetical protein
MGSGIREQPMMRRFFVGIGALLAIAVILVGVPIALIVVAGNPLPTSNQIHYIVTLVPDYGNVILLTKVLPCLAWFAWLLFAVPLLIEIGAGIAGRKTTKRIWLLKGQQQAAAALVTAVLVMFAGLGAFHGSAPLLAAGTPRAPITSIEPTNPVPSMTPVSQPSIEPAAAAVSASQAPRTQTLTHVVVPGDNLWDISEKYYGVGTRDLDIFGASTDTVQPGGQRLTNPNLIRPGWRLTVPDVPVPPAGPCTRPEFCSRPADSPALAKLRRGCSGAGQPSEDHTVDHVNPVGQHGQIDGLAIRPRGSVEHGRGVGRCARRRPVVVVESPTTQPAPPAPRRGADRDARACRGGL